MVSCAGPNAGSWLRAKPSCRQLTLPNSAFRIASRFRTGLPPLPNLPLYCKCGEPVAGVHDDHFLSCKRLCPTALRYRHDEVVRLVVDLFRKAGAPVRIEPRPFDGNKLAPDAEVILPGEKLLFDVVIPHPASRSRTSTVPLHAAHRAELAKEVKYGALASRLGKSSRPGP